MVPLVKEYDLKLIKDLVKDSNTSRIYGFILYTEQNPYVAKVLRDNDFWNTLDSISGVNWPIFSTRPLAQGRYSKPNYSERLHSQNTYNSSSITIGFMVETWEEPKINASILRDFGLEDSKMLPCFVAFIWDDNENLQSIAVSIEGNDVNTTYKSIKEIIEVITNTEKNVLPEYKNNIELFDLVSNELKALHFKHKMKKWGKITKKFLELFELFSFK